MTGLARDKFFVDEGDIHSPQLGQIAWSGQGNGLGQLTSLFDLSAFDGSASVDLLFQFGSDVSIRYAGINFDNMIIEGNVAAAPEPGIIALLGLGLASIGFARRKKS